MLDFITVDNPLFIGVNLLVGLILLVAGRQLFWLAVAAAGFLFALGLAANWLEAQAGWLAIILALGVGLIGALVALFLQRIAIGIAGFLIVGYLTVWLLGLFGVEVGNLAWLAYVVGGLVGLLVATSLFNVALIGLSALIGATLITQAIPSLPAWLVPLILLALFAVGVVIQAKVLNK
ncbi:MAG TPA: hypothetical protein PKE64_29235 [Anaerolineae bacterium]|nr:hypothetical protein [Anaerolineae bacterium]HMR68116.1 hypothetical protein [Anaerolineae bacterium]